MLTAALKRTGKQLLLELNVRKSILLRTLITDPVSLFALATRKHGNILQPNFSYHVEILWHICTKILPLDHPDLFIYVLLLQIIASPFKSFFEQHRSSKLSSVNFKDLSFFILPEDSNFASSKVHFLRSSG